VGATGLQIVGTTDLDGLWALEWDCRCHSFGQFLGVRVGVDSWALRWAWLWALEWEWHPDEERAWHIADDWAWHIAEIATVLGNLWALEAWAVFGR